MVLMPFPLVTSATLAYTYQTTDYVAIGDFIHALAGNGPILVSKLTGEVGEAGTALPTELYIREFEARAGRSA